ncbi:unnamed protein product [Mytilus edulis]|uniref:SMB domain-containing protein n=1 Tax=Mytilus edulis TaxID=6550 RepID=A0A8S3TFL3_MYTED|nr:unnamed protein product [Mytilus edulis]
MKISLFLFASIFVLCLPLLVRGREWINQTTISDTKYSGMVTGSDVSRKTVNETTTSDTIYSGMITGSDVSRKTVNETKTSDTSSRSILQVTGTAVFRNKTGKRNPIEKTTKSDQQTSTNPNMIEDECSAFGGCKLQERLIDRYCYCDEKCYYYKDCCEKHNTTTNIAQDRYKCVRMNTEKYHLKGFQTISMCSLKYRDNTIKQKCLKGNMVENGPPVVDYEKKDIFKNMYCAICNNVFDYIPFDIKFYNAKMFADEIEIEIES